MDEHSRVHPGCVNAANPYHECGVYCLEKIAAEGGGRKEKKKLDNYSGIKEGLLSKKKDEVGRVHPSCNKASNPYHECNEYCSKRTTEANTWRVNKDSDSRNGLKQGELTKKKDAERKVNPTCPKASNPDHECDEFCSKRFTNADSQGFKNQSGSKIVEVSRSFGRKKKGPESRPISPRSVDKSSGKSTAYSAEPKSPRSHFSRKKMEVEDGSFSSSEQHSEEINPQDPSVDKGQVKPSQSVPLSLNVLMATEKSSYLKDEEADASPKSDSYPNGESKREGTNSSKFSFSGIIRAPDESDEEEVQSVKSDSCELVGKYHVKASVSSILQAIMDKYGDIAANCQLESASMRAYYLECLCSVVEELQSTAFKQLTKSKIKEMFAVLKDVESAQIEVGWLRNLLDDISEAIEHIGQHPAIETSKANYDQALETTRKELESRMAELGLKEKEAAEARARVEQTKTRLNEIEVECSRLNKTISSIQSLVGKYQGKTKLEDEQL